MHPMLIIMPIGAYGLLTLMFARNWRADEILDGYVIAHLVIFSFIAVATEFLSSIQAIAFPGLLTVWLLFLLVCLAIAAQRLYRARQGLQLPERQGPTPLTVMLMGAIVFILATTLVTAILYPPNTWDSMTYHMSRVVHWINNQSISFYPTAITRQNYQMPLAEFAILHLQILAGSDVLANLVQWISFTVLIALGARTAAELGLSGRQKIIAAAVVATIPMAVLQASSTQNDLVVASFIMSFALFMLRLGKNLSGMNLFFTAAALGLALLTKGTAYLYCAAMGLSLAVPILWQRRFARIRFIKALGALALVVIAALMLNAGHLTRNYRLSGDPLSTGDQSYLNKDKSAVALIANIMRNAALHLATPSQRINGYMTYAMQRALGNRLNDPQTTFAGQKFGILFYPHEDLAGNLMHMVFVCLTVLALPTLWLQGRCQRALWYAIGVMFAAVLFCWLLLWQPWHSRLHTPLFAMAAPLLALTITEGFKGTGRRLSHLIVLIMFLYSVFFLLANSTRSLVSLDWYHQDRMALYFTNRKELLADYEQAIGMLPESRPQEVGLFLGIDDWEYPFWVIASQRSEKDRAITFRHVGVKNISRTIDEEVALPRYVIATKKLDDWQHAAAYVPVFTSDGVSVFEIKNKGSNLDL